MIVESQGPAPAVLMLRPVTGVAQTVLSSSVTILPPTPYYETVDLYGNNCQRVVLPSGTSTIMADMSVQTESNIDVHPDAPYTLVQDLPDAAVFYLLPSRFCQSDLMLELATQIAGKAQPGYGQVEAIRDWIYRNIKYQYGSSGPTTTAIDTAKSRKGVCRDFSHLGISLCRALRIPARMVGGYLHQLDPMDLHAWFEAFVGGRWYTIDATQTEPRGNRIVIAYGRDAADIAQMSEYGKVEMKEMTAYVNAA